MNQTLDCRTGRQTGKRGLHEGLRHWKDHVDLLPQIRQLVWSEPRILPSLEQPHHTTMMLQLVR